MKLCQLAGIALVATTCVGACSTVRSMTEDDYVVTSATPDAITLRFREGNLNKAEARAASHCQTTNRISKLETVSPDGGYSVANFRCT